MQEECQSSILYENMHISRLIVYATRIEEATTKRKSTYANRERSFDGGSSKNRHEIQAM